MIWPFKKRVKPPREQFDLYEFNPHPDISSFEIAFILKHLVNTPKGAFTGYGVMYVPRGQPLPALIARHYIWSAVVDA